MSSQPLSPRPSLRALFCAGTGLALLLLSLVPVLGLTRGSAGARCAVFLLLAAIAAGAAVPPALRRFPAGWLLTALLPIGLAFFLRALLLDYVTPDYETFLSQWAQAFRENGGFAAVRLPIGNYNAPYLYFLAAISYLPVPDLYLIKLFSILFDVVLAWGGCGWSGASARRTASGPWCASACCSFCPRWCSTGPAGASATPFTAR